VDIRCRRAAELVAASEQENAMPNIYKRGRFFWARFKVAGQEYRGSLRTTVRADAERRLKSWRKEVQDAVHFRLSPDKTWREAVLAWNQEATADLSSETVKRYKVSLKQCRHKLDTLSLKELNVAVLRALVSDRRKQGATTATIRRDLTAISSVIDHAIGENWMQDNPTLTIRHKRMRERRDPIVLPDESDIKTMLAKSPARFADAQEFARETGMREEEIFGLEHRQLGRNEITVYGKRNNVRVIPYSRKAKEIVKRQAQFIGSQFVFYHGDGQRWTSPSSRFGDIRRRVARKAAHFRGFRFHDLRHLYAVEYLRAKRGSLYDLQKLLGHDSVKTTEIYLKFLTPEQEKAALHGGGTKRGTEATVRH
jgi:integrase/recombinase XerD